MSIGQSPLRTFSPNLTPFNPSHIPLSNTDYKEDLAQFNKEAHKLALFQKSISDVESNPGNAEARAKLTEFINYFKKPK